MDTDRTEDDRSKDNRARSMALEQFGRYCAFCGNRKCKLRFDRINRARPETVTNLIYICEACAEDERPGLFACDGDDDRVGSRRRR
ncbi:hypothetical protein MAHJHV65_43660 [Mycobacterium avium subsp. hominissuis]|uniref:hypothetical protein n=1 Tax=Mycobacterium avium TaxID=1764 RepID=UPI0007A07A15|nr:hypothetical protein [Mycobacterium avium]MBZ4508387.1 hypothetical protein [Mycobacterium avium subsp. hominissuis]MCA2295895.1 hypothetical protein [Mycobacterium avium]WOF17896.1 hypothetical protein IHV82_15540 [Mycobacterium avium]